MSVSPSFDWRLAVFALVSGAGILGSTAVIQRASPELAVLSQLVVVILALVLTGWLVFCVAKSRRVSNSTLLVVTAAVAAVLVLAIYASLDFELAKLWTANPPVLHTLCATTPIS